MTKISHFWIQQPKMPKCAKQCPKYLLNTHVRHVYSIFSKFTKNVHVEDACSIFCFNDIRIIKIHIRIKAKRNTHYPNAYSLLFFIKFEYTYLICIFRGYFGWNIPPIGILDISVTKVNILVQHPFCVYIYITYISKSFFTIRELTPLS